MLKICERRGNFKVQELRLEVEGSTCLFAGQRYKTVNKYVCSHSPGPGQIKTGSKPFSNHLLSFVVLLLLTANQIALSGMRTFIITQHLDVWEQFWAAKIFDFYTCEYFILLVPQDYFCRDN